MSDSGRQPTAESTLAARPLAREDGDLTASQRAAVERMCGMIEEIRERAGKWRKSKRFRERPELCSPLFDLDKVLGWREILEPEWVNVLGIVGGRAYGKTTTLMTVLKRLRSPCGRAGKERDSGDDTALSGRGFPCDIVLPPINPEMFNGTPEFVLSWVFARMWPLLEELERMVKEPWCMPGHRRNAEQCEEDLAFKVRQAKERFEKVKSAITLLSSKYAEKAIQLSATRYEFQGEVFEQQRAGLELQHHIHSFFDTLFEVLGELGGQRSLLIVPFDDIDLAEERVAQLMYAVHAYLRHPGVVTILLGDWSAFSLALHREHARGDFTPELLPAGDRVRRAVGHLVDAALFKFLPAQNIAELMVDPSQLYKDYLAQDLPKIDEILAELAKLMPDGTGHGLPPATPSPVASLFSFKVALPALPDESSPTVEMRTRYVEVVGRDLRNFNAVRSAFAGLRAALGQLAKAMESARKKEKEEEVSETDRGRSQHVKQARDRVLQAVAVLRSVLARSGRKAELAARFDEMVRTDWVRGAEVLDLRALTAAREELDEESFDRLALAVLLYRDLHDRVVPLIDPSGKLEIVGSAAGGRTLWREVFAAPAWPWIEDADLPDVADTVGGATLVLLAGRLLEEIGEDLRPLGGGSLTSYLASRAAGEDPLARMLVRTALVLAALQIDPDTRLTKLHPDTGEGTGEGEVAAGQRPDEGRTTGGSTEDGKTSKPQWQARIDRWIDVVCGRSSTESPPLLPPGLLAPQWFITGVQLYRRAAVKVAGQRPLAPYADPIRHRWFWKLLVGGAAPLPVATDDRRRELGRLLDPLARGTVAAETMELPKLLALFQDSLVEVDDEGAWRVTGRGYDLLRDLRRPPGTSWRDDSSADAGSSRTEDDAQGDGTGTRDPGSRE